MIISGSPKASIIIRTYNEAKHLPTLLDSLTKQKNQDFETIVVDSGSLDSTREIAGDFGVKVLRISSHDFTFGYSLRQRIVNNLVPNEAVGRHISRVSFIFKSH